MRIREFTDVNEVDKTFFIEWNDFMHTYRLRKNGNVVYPGKLRGLLVQFAEVLANKTDFEIRLNLIMHLWSLWSLGQIDSDDIAPVLVRYDEAKEIKRKREIE